jgi:hypothetical protein
VLAVTDKILERPDVRLSALLVSGFEAEEEQEEEAKYFFPALRRLAVPVELRSDRSAAPRLFELVKNTMGADGFKAFVRSVSPREEARFLMPLRNSGCRPLAGHFKALYRLETTGLSQRIQREIVSRRGFRGYRVNGVDFSVVVNSEKHPIRRCTDTPHCDLQARLRLGVHVPARLEFDVTCETGLATKTFYLCDGTASRVSREASHLNMRLNDDFREGKQ